MKKVLLILFAIIFAINLKTQAQDFSAVNDGDTIYYYFHYIDNQLSLGVTYNINNLDGYRGSITIPDSVLYEGNYYIVRTIGSSAFMDCSELTSVNIPNSIISIGGSAFAYCSGLTSINIPNSITSINAGTFHGCSALTSITIPSSVTEIGSTAFLSCTGLTSITCSAQTPPALDMVVFYNVDKSIPLYVPEASVALYQAADGWHDFYNIHVGLDDIASDNNFDVLIYPNPTQDKAKIMIEDLSSKADVIVLDIMGKEVKRGVIYKGTKVLDIDLSGYAKGIYNIRIVNENINQTKKLIVQ